MHKSYSSDKAYLSLLFSRMKWPGIITRKRAITEIYKLFKQDNLYSVMCEAFIRELGNLNIETYVANMLLIPLRLQVERIDIRDLLIELKSAIAFPSPLSELLMQSIEDETESKIGWSNLHSGDPPDSFVPEKYFKKYNRKYLPGYYFDSLENIEQRYNIPMLKQWAFECEKIFQRTGISKYTTPYTFTPRNEHSKSEIFDIPQSECFRSAYMRALAWAVDQQSINEAEAIELIVHTCPLDIDLWQIEDTSRPTWWPYIDSYNGNLDDVWQKITDLFNSQTNVNNPDFIAHASGLICNEENVILDLSIHGILIMGTGDSPNLDEELDSINFWLNEKINTEVGFITQNIKNLYLSNDPTSFVLGLTDKLFIAPMSACLKSYKYSSRWEIPRAFRGIRMLTPFVAPPKASITIQEQQIEIAIKENVIGKWFSWNEKLSEKWYWFQMIPPPTSVALTINRAELSTYSFTEDVKYAWIICLTKYEQKNSYSPFEKSEEYRYFPFYQ